MTAGAIQQTNWGFVGLMSMRTPADRGINDDFLRSDGSVNPNGGARSASDHWSDLMRGVDTMNDPSNGGTTEVSNVSGYNHFTDGFGNYRTYDNSTDTPEDQGENGTWTRMTQAP